MLFNVELDTPSWHLILIIRPSFGDDSCQAWYLGEAFFPRPNSFLCFIPEKLEKYIKCKYLPTFKCVSNFNLNFGSVLCYLCDPRETAWFS